MKWAEIVSEGHTSAKRIHNAFRDKWFNSELKDYGKPDGLFEVQADLASGKICCNDVMFREYYTLLDYNPEKYDDWRVAKSDCACEKCSGFDPKKKTIYLLRTKPYNGSEEEGWRTLTSICPDHSDIVWCERTFQGKRLSGINLIYIIVPNDKRNSVNIDEISAEISEKFSTVDGASSESRQHDPHISSEQVKNSIDSLENVIIKSSIGSKEPAIQKRTSSPAPLAKGTKNGAPGKKPFFKFVMLFLILSLILVSYFIITGFPTIPTMETRFETAKHENTVPAYETFINRYKEGQLVEEAKMRIEEIKWNNANQVGIVDAFLEYLREYPTGNFKDEAEKSIKKLKQFVIKDKRFVEEELESVPSGSKISVVGCDGGAMKLSEGNFFIRDGRTVFWVDGFEHIYKVGKCNIFDHTFESSQDDPLHFMVDKERGYVHIAGKGTLTMPDGKIVKLPKE